MGSSLTAAKWCANAQIGPLCTVILDKKTTNSQRQFCQESYYKKNFTLLFQYRVAPSQLMHFMRRILAPDMCSKSTSHESLFSQVTYFCNIFKHVYEFEKGFPHLSKNRTEAIMKQKTFLEIR